MFDAKAARRCAAFFCALLALSGCASCGLPAGSLGSLDKVLAASGFQHRRLASADFPVHAWWRGKGAVLTVVIEGDGAAWFNPRWPPTDPTPEKSQAAALALMLPGAGAYLARPCQFEPTGACQLAHWTTDRYAPALIAALDAALDALKREAGAQGLRLIGHSGGGVVALSLARRRTDVLAVATLMSPLASAAWTRKLGLSPLSGDDPIDEPALSMPAWHVAGGRDVIVPAAIVRYYAHEKGGEFLFWPEAEHACWSAERARELIGRMP